MSTVPFQAAGLTVTILSSQANVWPKLSQNFINHQGIASVFDISSSPRSLACPSLHRLPLPQLLGLYPIYSSFLGILYSSRLLLKSPTISSYVSKSLKQNLVSSYFPNDPFLPISSSWPYYASSCSHWWLSKCSSLKMYPIPSCRLYQNAPSPWKRHVKDAFAKGH